MEAPKTIRFVLNPHLWKLYKKNPKNIEDMFNENVGFVKSENISTKDREVM